MTTEHERLAEALAIQRLHGDDAPRWIAERIGALALAGDAAGVDRFFRIARGLESAGSSESSAVRDGRQAPATFAPQAAK